MMREIPGIPYRFDDPELLKLALTHRSADKVNNERLEFLGDSILSAAVTSRLYELKPDNNEGELSRLRTRVVRGDTLASLAAGLKLGDYIMLGEGEMKSGGFNRDSILADALEAVFGAIYLDGGYTSCAAAILHVCEPVIASLPSANELKDPKTRLQEWAQARGHALPVYTLESEEGPPHRKQFRVLCTLNDLDISVSGSGSSRQKAEQSSADATLKAVSDKSGK